MFMLLLLYSQQFQILRFFPLYLLWYPSGYLFPEARHGSHRLLQNLLLFLLPDALRSVSQYSASRSSSFLSRISPRTSPSFTIHPVIPGDILSFLLSQWYLHILAKFKDCCDCVCCIEIIIHCFFKFFYICISF